MALFELQAQVDPGQMHGLCGFQIEPLPTPSRLYHVVADVDQDADEVGTEPGLEAVLIDASIQADKSRLHRVLSILAAPQHPHRDTQQRSLMLAVDPLVGAQITSLAGEDRVALVLRWVGQAIPFRSTHLDGGLDRHPLGDPGQGQFASLPC